MRKFTRKHKTIPRIDHAKFRKIIHMVPLRGVEQNVQDKKSNSADGYAKLFNKCLTMVQITIPLVALRDFQSVLDNVL